MKHPRLALLVLELALLMLAAVPRPCLGDDQPSPCTGKYKDGQKPTDAELKEILFLHYAWLKDIGIGADLDDPKIADDSSLKDANLNDANLTSAVLNGADLSHMDLNGADLSGASLKDANLNVANLNHADLHRAVLKGANLERGQLEGASLKGAQLEGADLSSANLHDANLNGTDLKGANLVGARLTTANLDGAYLGWANLSYAHLTGASLKGANLEWAELTGTNLNVANLNHADLTGAELTGANFGSADLTETYLDFDSDTSPKISPGIASAQNLELVTFHDESAALVKLRKEFKDLGLRTQENQLTYAIRRTELNRKKTDSIDEFLHSGAERFFNTVAFDWTCQYGMSPSRPLLIVAAIGLVLSIVYIFPLLAPRPTAGIWAVWDEHRIKQAEGSKEPQPLSYGFPGSHSDYSFILLAVYFSLLSATRIGWRELNVGTWVTRIQPREYSLRATGWVRVVSGIQSLISVYLVALTILTYFGAPFEY